MKRPVYLVITSYFPTPEEPWRCCFTFDQVQAIRRATDKYEIVVVRSDMVRQYDFHGIRVFGFRAQNAGGWICPSLLHRGNVRKLFATLASAHIDVQDIAIVHGHLVPDAAYVHALKVRNPEIFAILQFHDADPYGMLFGSGRLGSIKKMSYFRYHRSLVEKMDMLVAISRNVAKVVAEAPHQTVFADYEPMKAAMRVLRRFRQARVRPAYVLHNGVDRSLFSAGPKTARPDAFTIGCVGTFRDLKDQLTLLRAVSIVKDEIPNLAVRIVGSHHSGDMYERCVTFIRDESLPVEIIPSLGHERLADFYRSLDLFVLPSHFEGLGCVFLEASACGTPFITCAGQGMDDFVTPSERDLWLCRARDPDDLAAKIRTFYRQRPRQHLADETDIDVLIPRFLEQVESERNRTCPPRPSGSR